MAGTSAEKRLTKRLLDALNKLDGVLAFKRHQSPFATAGQADVWGVVYGRHFECEVKGVEIVVDSDPNGKRGPTPKQRKFLDDLAAVGSITAAVGSIGQVDSFVDRIRRISEREIEE